MQDRAWYDVASEALARKGKRPSRRKKFKVVKLPPGIPAGSGLHSGVTAGSKRRRHVKKFLDRQGKEGQK